MIVQESHNCTEKPEKEKNCFIWFSGNDKIWQFTDKWYDVETEIYYCPFCGMKLKSSIPSDYDKWLENLSPEDRQHYDIFGELRDPREEE